MSLDTGSLLARTLDKIFSLFQRRASVELSSRPLTRLQCDADVRSDLRMKENARDYGATAKKAKRRRHVCREYTRGYFAAPDYCRSVFFVRWTVVKRNAV